MLLGDDFTRKRQKVRPRVVLVDKLRPKASVLLPFVMT